MWTEKYRPTHLEGVVGNEEAKIAFVKWLKSWTPRDKAALLYGPAGTGKTALVHAATNDLNFLLIEMNASDIRNEKEINRVIGPASTEYSLDKIFLGAKGVLLFLDEVDGVLGREDYGGMAAILKLIERTKVPIVLAANNTGKEGVQSLLRTCKAIKINRIRLPILVDLLKNICILEKVRTENSALELIAEKSRGDLRSAINDLQSLASEDHELKLDDVAMIPMRDRSVDITETLKTIFSAQTVREAKRAFDESDRDYETIYQSIHDNLPSIYRDSEALAVAYDCLSKADLCFGRIKKTQEWHLLSYALELAVSGIVLANEKAKPEEMMRVRFPPLKFIMLGRSRFHRAAVDELASRIGSRYKVSKRIAKADYIPFIKIIATKRPDQLRALQQQLTISDEMVSTL